jgi:NitT/TauT family transport system substrate-binding protein
MPNCIRPAILTAALLALTACRSKPPVPNGLYHVVLQTDWYPQPEMGGFYEAQLQGLYRAQGLDVEILPGGPGIVGGQMIATGQAQFAMGSSDNVLVDVSRGVPEVAVAATMQHDPQAIMLHAESPVQSFADLNGRTIAVRPGSIWFQYLVKRYHLDQVREVPATYSVASFVQDPNYIQQAFITSEPFFAEHAGSPVRTLLVSSTEFQPYRVYFTSRQFLADHPDIVRKFVAASTQGWRNYLADPAPVNAAIKDLNPAMRSDQMNYSIQTLKSGHFLDGDGTPTCHLGHLDATRFTTTYKQLVDLGVIAHPFDPTTAFTLQFNP